MGRVSAAVPTRSLQTPGIFESSDSFSIRGYACEIVMGPKTALYNTRVLSQRGLHPPLSVLLSLTGLPPLHVDLTAAHTVDGQ